MHAVGKPWKLNLYTGEFYDERNGKRLGRIKEEDLIAIWQIEGIRKIIFAERAMYEELHRKDPVRFQELPPLLVLNENEKIQNTKTNRRKVAYSYKIGTDLELFSHRRKAHLELRTLLNRMSFRRLNKNRIAMK